MSQGASDSRFTSGSPAPDPPTARGADPISPGGHSQQPPRIVLRFGFYTGIALALAAILIILLVRHFTIDQAERAAVDRARYVSQVALTSEL